MVETKCFYICWSIHDIWLIGQNPVANVSSLYKWPCGIWCILDSLYLWQYEGKLLALNQKHNQKQKLVLSDRATLNLTENLLLLCKWLTKHSALLLHNFSSSLMGRSSDLKILNCSWELGTFYMISLYECEFMKMPNEILKFVVPGLI